MKNPTFRTVIAAGHVAAGLAVMLMAAPAQAQLSWYAGASATNRNGDCAGQGYSPQGCTAVEGLTFATVLLYDRDQNTDNFTTGTANLATASLAMQTQNLGGGSTGQASANFAETFTIVGNLPTPVDVLVTLTIDSNISGPDVSPGTPLVAGMGNSLGTQFYYERYINGGRCDGPFPSGYACDQGFGHIVRTISYAETVDNDHRSFFVNATLAGGAYRKQVDATALMSLTLPQGLSYTTASGVFPLPAVPEPHSWALMLAGLVFVGVHRRSKTRVLGAGSPEH
jgi:hypothetical protein